MAFFKKIQQHINKKWYPRSVLVGSPIGTEQVAKRLAAESTVAPADVMAVLQALSLRPAYTLTIILGTIFYL